MTRALLTLAVVAAASAWAAAQNAAGLTADRVHHLRANRGLLEDLLNRAVDLSDAGNPLDRADKCREAAGALGAEIGYAVRDQDADPDRVAELADHLATLLDTGLGPALDEARRPLAPASAEYKRYLEVRDRARQEAAATGGRIPDAGGGNKVGDSRRVAEAKRRLAAAADKLAPP